MRITPLGFLLGGAACGLALIGCGGSLDVAELNGPQPNPAATNPPTSEDGGSLPDGFLCTQKLAKRASFKLIDGDNRPLGCTDNAGRTELNGTVVSTGRDRIRVDTCCATCSCTGASQWDVVVDVGDAVFWAVQPGAQVRVVAAFEPSCAATLQIDQIDTIVPPDPGPGIPIPRLAFAIGSGTIRAIPEAPYRIEARRSCSERGLGCAGKLPGSYALRVSATSGGDSPTWLETGDQETLTIGGRLYGFDNRLARVSPSCQEDKDWSYVVRPVGIR